MQKWGGYQSGERGAYHQEVDGYGGSDDLAPTTNYELVDVYCYSEGRNFWSEHVYILYTCAMNNTILKAVVMM